MSAHDVHLRADEAPGMLDDWTGPVAWRSFDGQRSAGVWLADYAGRPSGSLSMADLDARRPEVAARIVAWAFAGVPCPSSAHPAPDDRGSAYCICKGTRRLGSHDLTPFLPTTFPGGRIASVEHSAALLVASVRGIVAGVGPVADVALPWHIRTDTGMRYRADRSSLRRDDVLAKVEQGYFRDGWEVLIAPPGGRGDELRVFGQTMADAELRRRRVATLDHDNTLTLPEAPRG
jgi:hypothetical protein